MEITLHNLDETKRLAHILADHLQVGDIILLNGDLGVGKSEFTRFIIQKLTSESTHVPSPTFTIVQTYDCERLGAIHHFDLYRIEDEAELLELGIDDAFLVGVSFIEWPDRLGYRKPEKCLIVNINRGCLEDERIFEFKSVTEYWRDRLRAISDQLGVG